MEIKKVPTTLLGKLQGNIIVVVIGLLGIFLVIVSILYAISNSRSQQNKAGRVKVSQTAFTTQKEKVFNPEGSIYLSLTPKKENTMGIYEYNFKKNTIVPYYLPKEGHAFTGKFKASSTDLLVAEVINGDNLQIKQVSKKGVATLITDSNIDTKRHPSYSAFYDAVIFAGKEVQTKTLGKPNDFNVYMKKIGGKETKITQGAMPVLTPDGKSVVVMRGDGLYKVDLAGTSSEHIWKTKKTGTALNQQFAISPKGKFLAWSYPEGGVMYILQVSSWTPFKADIKYTIKTHAFWPVFSPNEDYLAFEEVEWTNPPTKAKLVVMDLLSLKRNIMQDLDGFKQLSLFINEWK